MKKIFIFCVALISFNGVQAQHAFYIEPTVNFGTSNVTQSYIQTPLNNTSFNRSNKKVYSVGMLAGYQIKKWKLETGLQYMVSGYRLERVYFGSLYSDIQHSSTKQVYSHLMIPMQVSYAFPLYDNITLEPVLGIAESFNIGETNIAQYKDDKQSLKTGDDAFSNRYNRFSLWGTSGFRFEYRIDPKFSILAGSTFQYMMTNFIQSTQLSYYTSQHNYAFSVNAGLRIKM